MRKNANKITTLKVYNKNTLKGKYIITDKIK